jgi:hypothetical protein
MKDIRLALRSFLLADASIAAAVGVRVYPIKLPQGTTAVSIVYNRISGGGDYHLQGLSGFAHHRFQIDAWASTANAATSLADLIRDRIDGYRGDMGTDSPPVVTVHGIFMADQREDYDDEAKLHRMSRDYFIDFMEL